MRPRSLPALVERTWLTPRPLARRELFRAEEAERKRKREEERLAKKAEKAAGGKR